MPEAIADTSPLQYLYQIGQLELLQKLYGGILVPTGVATELARGLELGASVPRLGYYPWIRILSAGDIAGFGEAVGLGRGEREVLAMAASREEALVLLDDGLARRFAKILTIRCTGTLGVLLKAKQAGLLDAVRPHLDALETCGFRFDIHMRAQVLDLAGELSPEQPSRL